MFIRLLKYISIQNPGKALGLLYVYKVFGNDEQKT